MTFWLLSSALESECLSWSNRISSLGFPVECLFFPPWDDRAGSKMISFGELFSQVLSLPQDQKAGTTKSHCPSVDSGLDVLPQDEAQLISLLMQALLPGGQFVPSRAWCPFPRTSVEGMWLSENFPHSQAPSPPGTWFSCVSQPGDELARTGPPCSVPSSQARGYFSCTACLPMNHRKHAGVSRICVNPQTPIPDPQYQNVWRSSLERWMFNHTQVILIRKV